MGYMEGALNSGAAVARRIAVARRRRQGTGGVSRNNVRRAPDARRADRAGRVLRPAQRPGVEDAGAVAGRAGGAAARCRARRRRPRSSEGRAGRGDRHRRLRQHGRDRQGPDGQPEQKIEIARRAALDLVDQFVRYAEDHPDEPVLLGLYEFSRRRGEPDCRPIVPMGPPDRERAAAAIAKLDADGGTPIGDAMITAKRELDATGLTRRHLLRRHRRREHRRRAAGARRRGDRPPARRRAAVDLLRRLRHRGEPVQRACENAGGLVLVGRERQGAERHARLAAARQDPGREIAECARLAELQLRQSHIRPTLTARPPAASPAWGRPAASRARSGSRTAGRRLQFLTAAAATARARHTASGPCRNGIRRAHRA